jgi:hypothetical protein
MDLFEDNRRAAAARDVPSRELKYQQLLFRFYSGNLLGFHQAIG